MRSSILTTGVCSVTLLLVACGGGSSGGSSGASFDTSDAKSLDTASAEEIQAVDKSLEAQDKAFTATGEATGAIDLATPSFAAITKQLGSLQVEAAQSLATQTVTVDAQVDTNGDGTNDATVSGSGTVTVSDSSTQTSGSASLDYDVTVTYTADATFTETEGSYTVKSGSAVTVDMEIDIDYSETTTTAAFDYTVGLNAFSVDWTEGSDSGNTTLSGTVSMETGTITISDSDDAIAASFSGDIEIDLSGTVTSDGASQDVALYGEGSFGFDGDTFSSNAEYFVQIDGTVYGPFDEDDAIVPPIAAQ